MKLYKPTSSHHLAKHPILPMLTWPNTVAITVTMAILQTNVNHPHPSWSDHRHPPRNSCRDKHPHQPISHDPQPARTDAALTDPLLRGTINTIFGSFASGGSTSSAKKKHLCHFQSINHITHSHHRHCMPPITFTNDDFHGVDHQQDDPMVITVELENYAVKKVLIDQGSLVDILY